MGFKTLRTILLRTCYHNWFDEHQPHINQSIQIYAYFFKVSTWISLCSRKVRKASLVSRGHSDAEVAERLIPPVSTAQALHHSWSCNSWPLPKLLRERRHLSFNMLDRARLFLKWRVGNKNNKTSCQLPGDTERLPWPPQGCPMFQDHTSWKPHSTAWTFCPCGML